HNYERFALGDKCFLVTGGGGGPRRTVNTTSTRLFQNDAYRDRVEVRPFHYVRLKITENAIVAETRFYKGGRFYTGDQFTIGLYPNPDFSTPADDPQFSDTGLPVNR
ncbi:MAG: hypothetical protein H7X80_03200, partial [bacterium]|nr:hypothetical protein [Candidatus Kapabacteria bacterium]